MTLDTKSPGSPIVSGAIDPFRLSIHAFPKLKLCWGPEPGALKKPIPSHHVH